jgi:hypothetical protein
MTQEQRNLEVALAKALALAGERMSGDEAWGGAFRALVAAVDAGIAGVWDGKAKPTRFVGRVLRKQGFDDRAVEIAMTALGEVLEGQKRQELVIARGVELVEWYERFGRISGLRSCMTGGDRDGILEMYAKHPKLVSLWVLLDDEGEPVARALMWEGVRVKVDEDWVDVKVLDRVYYSGVAHKERLLALAEEAGAWARRVQSYDEIDQDLPLVSPSGQRAIIARVYLDWDVSADLARLRFPYMDTFKYLRFGRDGKMILSTKKPAKGGYDKLVHTDGSVDGYGLYDEWDRRRHGDEIFGNSDEVTGPECYCCGAPLTEDRTYTHNGLGYCEDCLRENFFECAGCGDVRSIEGASEYEGSLYCGACWRREFTNCTSCRDAVHNNDALHVGNGVYCQECFDERYVHCGGCGEAAERDSAVRVGRDSYCRQCYSEMESVACTGCGCITPRQEVALVNRRPYCAACSETQRCRRCGIQEIRAWLMNIEGHLYCVYCQPMVAEYGHVVGRQLVHCATCETREACAEQVDCAGRGRRLPQGRVSVVI